MGPNYEWFSGSLYASLLFGAHGLVGDAFLAGGLMAVFGGLGCVVAATRLLGPWAGLWLLAQIGFLWASTVPGPLILVAMCLLWAVYWSQQDVKGLRTGPTLLLAYVLAEWSWPVALGIIFIARARWTVLASYTFGVLCFHYALGMEFVFPQWVSTSTSGSMTSIVRVLVSDWVIGFGVAALVWGGLRGNQASRFLLFLAAIQTLALATGIGEPEHIVLAQVFIILGIAAIETGPALLVLSLVLLGLRLPSVLDGTDRHRAMVPVVQALASNPENALCTSVDFVRPTLSDGWIRPCVGLEQIARSPTEIYPIHIRAASASLKAPLFVTEDTDILHTYPWLQGLLEAPYPEGFQLLEQSEGWKVFWVTP